MEFIYEARFQPDEDGGFIVTFPDVPEAITQGEDRTEAYASAVEALGLALRGYVAMGRALPVPAARRHGMVPVAVDAMTAMKLALTEVFRASGKSKAELARLLGKAETEAYRILDPDHNTKPAVLEQALAVLGKRVAVSVLDAA